MKVLRIGISGIALVSLIGCSSTSLGSKRVDYRSGAAQAPSLEVPPDLTTPGSDKRYTVPQGDGENVATFSDYSKGGAVAEQGRGASVVLPEVTGVRLDRNETQRWLVVNDKPENVWFVVRAFLQENGLAIQNESRDWSVRRRSSQGYGDPEQVGTSGPSVPTSAGVCRSPGAAATSAALAAVSALSSLPLSHSSAAAARAGGAGRLCVARRGPPHPGGV